MEAMGGNLSLGIFLAIKVVVYDDDGASQQSMSLVNVHHGPGGMADLPNYVNIECRRSVSSSSSRRRAENQGWTEL